MLGSGETWRRVPVLQTRTWQNVAIVCPVAVGRGRGCAGAMLLLWPPTPSSPCPLFPLLLPHLQHALHIRSVHSAQSGSEPEWVSRQAPCSLTPLPHQPWCHQQNFQKEESEILVFLFFCAFKACLELRSGQFAHSSKVRSSSMEASGMDTSLCHLLQ